VNLVAIFTRFLSMQIKSRAKLLISERTTPSIELKGKLYGTIRLMIKKFYPLADRIIVNSKGIKKDLVVNFGLPEWKIDVLYNPMDIKKIKMFAEEELKEHSWFLGGIPIIINVGSLNVPKAQEYLLRAFRIVREKVNCRLVILGEGIKKNELEQLAMDLGINNDVAFLGFQNNPFKFISRSSVFVLSSVYEGFPNVLIEAMACGTPVISTRCQSGPEDIITDSVNGLLVPIKDAEKMAEAILTIINNPDLSSAMASKAKETVLRFDVKNAIKNYEKLIGVN
jgi:glycosyltransferase involved in cell wall biosynthesis